MRAGGVCGTALVLGPAGGSSVREEVQRRLRAIARSVVSICSSRGIEFGSEHVCGKGENHTVCQEGEAR